MIKAKVNIQNSKIRQWPLKFDFQAHIDKIQILKKHLVPINKSDLRHAESGFLGVVDKYGHLFSEYDFIMKASPSHMPEMADIEYLSNQILDVLDRPIAMYGVKSVGKKRIFVSLNFMKDIHLPATPKHFSSYFKEEEEYSVETILKLLKDKIDNIDEFLLAQDEFLTLTLADSFIGNYDRHPGNLMLIYMNGAYVLSPAYDNISMFALKSDDEFASISFGGRISTKNAIRPLLNDYLEHYIELGFKTLVANECKKYLERKKYILHFIKESALSKKRKNDFNKLIKANFQIIEDYYAKTKS